MPNDESPVDAVPNNVGTPPVDDAPHADASAGPAGSSAVPARRRRTTASATAATPAATRTRTRRRAAPVPPPDQTEPVAAEPVPPAAPAPPIILPEATAAARTEEAPAPRRRASTRGATAGRRTRRAAETAEPAAPEPESLAAPPAEVTEAGISVATEAPVAAPEALEARPARARRPRARKTAEPQPEAAPVEAVAEAPAASAPESPPEAPAGRRRGGRGRRGRGKAETAAEVVAELTAEAPAEAPEAIAAIEAAPAPAEAPAAEAPSRRRTRGGRRKAEQGAAATVEAPLHGTRVVARRGRAELLVNNETWPPVLFFGNIEGPKEERHVVSEVQRAAGHGVHLHSTLIELPCPLPPDDTVYETLDSRIRAIVDADPKGYVIPRLVFLPAPGWRKQYPNEVNHYADGSTDDPSIASDLFWREAEHALRALVEHVQRLNIAERVIGYHLERGEWFHPAEGGYDRSYANREAFRNWLRAKYHNSEAALRAAWYDGQVQFYTAEIPPAPAVERPEMMFFEPRKQRRWIDFLEFTSEVTANRLVALARTIKEASDNRALVSLCYGYTFEFGHTFSGHLDLARVLTSPYVDIVAGPPSYRDRQPGGPGSYPGPVDSMAVHGKLWVSEDDTKTYLAPGADTPDDFNPKVEGKHATEQVELRAVGKALAHQTGVAFMDTWGEGWLDSDDIWRVLEALPDRYRELLKARKPWSPEVAVLVSERSLLHVQKGDAFLRRLLQEQRDSIERSGASVGFYLQTDVTSKNFPTDAKLYLFLNPYRLPADQRAAIKEKLQGGGRTLVWMYAAGVCDERGEGDESAHELVGITLRQQSWNSEVGSRITDARHPVTEQIQNRNVGVRERLNPSFYVDDDAPGLVTLGEYHQTGLPSIALKRQDGWNSVFCGEPTLTGELLRGLCRFAGVHLYEDSGEDYVFAGDGFVTIHATRDGNRTLHLPAPLALYDFAEGRLVAEDARDYRTFFRGKTTYAFFVGTVEEMRKMGLPGVERTGRGRRGARSAKAGPEEPSVEPTPQEAALPPEEADAEARNGLGGPISAAGEGEEYGALVAAGAPGEAEAGEEAPVAGETPAEAERRRRRRRRGGRGRGRRHHGGENGGGPGNGNGAPPPPGEG